MSASVTLPPLPMSQVQKPWSSPPWGGASLCGSVASGASTARVSSTVRDGRHGGLPQTDDDGVGLEVWRSKGENRGKYGNNFKLGTLPGGGSSSRRREPAYAAHREPSTGWSTTQASTPGSLSARGQPLSPSAGVKLSQSPLMGVETSRSQMASVGSPQAPLAGVGPLTMPPAPSVRKARSDRLGAEDVWLESLCQDIATKASQRHRTVQQALKTLDADDDGLIEKRELEYFFRAYDLPVPLLDRFMQRFGCDHASHVDYQTFVNFMALVVKGEPWSPPDCCGSDGSTRAPSLASREASYDVEERRRVFDEQFGHLFEHMRHRVAQRFARPRDVFRLVDCDRDGRITRNEMRAFFRALNMEEQTADGVFRFFDLEGCDKADYEQFVACTAPHIAEPPVPVFHWGVPGSSRHRCSQPERHQAEHGPASAVRQDDESVHAVGEEGIAAHGVSRQRLRELMDEIRSVPVKARHYCDAPVVTSGKIRRLEARAFLCSFGWPVASAERFFNFLDEDGSDSVDYAKFMDLFREASKGRGQRSARSAHWW